MSSDEFVAFLTGRAGDYLRSVTRYDASGYDIVYLRSDLDVDAIHDRVDRAHRQIVDARITAEDEAESDLGETYTTVQIRDELVIINIPQHGSTGTLVSLEPEAARQLTSFLAECVKREHPSSLPA